MAARASECYAPFRTAGSWQAGSPESDASRVLPVVDDLSRFDGGAFLALHHFFLKPQIEVRRINYMQRPLSRNDYDATIVVFRLTRRFDF